MNFIPAFFVFSDLQQIVEERSFLTTNGSESRKRGAGNAGEVVKTASYAANSPPRPLWPKGLSIGPYFILQLVSEDRILFREDFE
mgnify:CR=1 FL=1